MLNVASTGIYRRFYLNFSNRFLQRLSMLRANFGEDCRNEGKHSQVVKMTESLLENSCILIFILGLDILS